MATCTNSAGGYNCTCFPGYFGDGVNCTDSDECMDFDAPGMLNGFNDTLYGSHNCSFDGFCTNTEGNYNCTCYPGYDGNGFVCDDVDECGLGRVSTTKFIFVLSRIAKVVALSYRIHNRVYDYYHNYLSLINFRGATEDELLLLNKWQVKLRITDSIQNIVFKLI